MSKKRYISRNINEGMFETEDTIIENTFYMDYEKQEMEKGGVSIISDGKKARGYYLEQPMMVVASTGSGKTMRIIIPYALSCVKAGDSLVLHDPKGELYKYLKTELEKQNYNILVIDFRDPSRGERFNLAKIPASLYKQGNKARADELFGAIINTLFAGVKSNSDPFWHTVGALTLTGEALLACDLFPKEDVTLDNIYELHLQGNEKFADSTYMKKYYEMHGKETYWKMIAPFMNSPNETRASLDAVITGALSKYVRNESVVDWGADSSFEVSDIVEKKTALFIISRDESSVYNDLISAIIDQIYEVVIDLAEEKYNGHLPRRMSIILDEFGNLAPICDINAKITVSRSRNIGWCLCCQSLDQLNVRYGQDIARIIMGNCNLAYMYSSDIELLKMISELCGRTTDEFTNETRPLLSVDQLRHFNKNEGQTLFLLERLRPFISYLPWVSEYGIKPEKTYEIEKRVPKKIDRIDFKSIVKKEKKEEMERNIINEEIRRTASCNHRNVDSTNSINNVEKPKNQMTMVNIRFDKVASSTETAIVLAETFNIPIEKAEILLDGILSRRSKGIRYISIEVANELKRKLEKIGTTITIVKEEKKDE